MCDHKGARVTINRRVMDGVTHRTYRCQRCSANWRTVEVDATQEALERAYKLCVKRRKRSDATRRAVESWL